MSKISPTLSVLVATLATLGPVGARAADSPTETIAHVLANSGITASGYLAASFYHSSGGNTDHQFDTAHQAFQFDQAGLNLAYQPKQGFGAVLNLIAGDDAKVVNAAESASASSNNMFDLLQGYVQYVDGGLTVEAGKFTTLVGAEVIAPTGNTNYSRSFLFYAEPMTHTGIRATYAFNDAVSVTLGVNNGWNYTTVTSGAKTAEFGIALTPTSAFSLSAQGYIGDDPVDLTQRTDFDTVATYNVTSALQFVASYDWGRQDPSAMTTGGEWSGVAVYANYRFNPQWRVSLRGESFDDRNGFMLGTPQKVKEGTVTVGYDPVADFELRLEGRYDSSNRPTFSYTHLVPATGGAVTTYSANQSEFAVQGVYSF